MVPCPVCQQPVSWLTTKDAAKVLDISGQRMRQLITEGAFPGAVKYAPGGSINPLWKIPIVSVIAYKDARSIDG